MVGLGWHAAAESHRTASFHPRDEEGGFKIGSDRIGKLRGAERVVRVNTEAGYLVLG